MNASVDGWQVRPLGGENTAIVITTSEVWSRGEIKDTVDFPDSLNSFRL